MKSQATKDGSPNQDDSGKPVSFNKEAPELTPPIQVIVDIVFRHGVFFVSVENISDQPAYRVSIHWETPFRGLGGTQTTSDLPLFKNIDFLAPHKVIETLLDTSQAYFQRREPTHLEATIQHKDAWGQSYCHTIHHNLEIYRDLVYQTTSDRQNKA